MESCSDVSRRQFLAGVATVPFMTGLERTRAGASSRPRVAVVGAGSFGGWTALHLARNGAEVVLIDAWGAGNPRASSGGETRVIRAVYGPDRIYVEMVKRAYSQWERLAASADEKLYVETGALWLHRGDDSYVRSSLAILDDAGFPVEKLTIAQSMRRYPQIDFRGVESVFFEQRAGALFARLACLTVLAAFEKAGGKFRIGQVESLPALDASPAALELADGSRVEADVFVFACGPWLGKIFPDVIGESIRPTRQEVFYFGTPPGSQNYRPERFPVWIDFGERIYYGIPDVNGQGIKIADDTRGDLFDPSEGDRSSSAAGLERARSLLAHRFPGLANAPLLKAEVCQYENSPDGHLIIDRHPRAENVWLVGGGSGHGFKLSPSIGEMVSDAILAGADVPRMFRIGRLGAEDGTSTQFDRKLPVPPDPQ